MRSRTGKGLAVEGEGGSVCSFGAGPSCFQVDWDSYSDIFRVPP